MANTLLQFHTNYVWTPKTCRDPSRNEKRKNASRKSRTQGHKYDSQNLTGINKSRQKRPLPLSEPGNESHLTAEDGHVRHREPSFVGIDPSFPVRLASETTIINLGDVPTLAQRGEIETNVNEDGSQFEQLVSATCSANSLESPQECPSAATSHESFGPQLGMTDLDFFGPQLDMAYLNFSGPQLDMAELDCVDVQPSIDPFESEPLGSNHPWHAPIADQLMTRSPDSP